MAPGTDIWVLDAAGVPSGGVVADIGRGNGPHLAKLAKRAVARGGQRDGVRRVTVHDAADVVPRPERVGVQRVLSSGTAAEPASRRSFPFAAEVAICSVPIVIYRFVTA